MYKEMLNANKAPGTVCTRFIHQHVPVQKCKEFRVADVAACSSSASFSVEPRLIDVVNQAWAEVDPSDYCSIEESRTTNSDLIHALDIINLVKTHTDDEAILRLCKQAEMDMWIPSNFDNKPNPYGRILAKSSSYLAVRLLIDWSVLN